KRHQGRFKVAYSITGVCLDQWAEFCPDVIDIFKRLAETGCCEFLGETYHHSLSFLYSREEFTEQVTMHTRKIQELFGQTPRVFRNSEVIYNNDLAYFVAGMQADGDSKDADAAGSNGKNGSGAAAGGGGGGGGKPRWLGCICEGADHLLGYRS